MKMLVVLVWLMATSRAEEEEEALADILKSHQKSFKLYEGFKARHSVHYQPEEDSARLMYFLKSGQLVAALNADSARSAEYELNDFSLMSSSEKEAYVGLNISLTSARPAPAVSPDLASLPETKVWTSEGAVTPAETQSECRSSWALAAANVLDTQYKIATGVLHSFAEQEFLDCVYTTDGCKGGFYDDAFQYTIDSGRLGFNRWGEYSYYAHSCDCGVESKRDALIAAEVTSIVKVAGSEESIIEALSHSAVSAALEVSEEFMQYSFGIHEDTACNSVPNHALALVGYTKTYVLAKNSWGPKWGENGFVKLGRDHDNCGLWKYASYPVLRKTGIADEMGSDEAVAYNHTLLDPHPNCGNFTDRKRGCNVKHCDTNTAEEQENCKATCNNCPVKFKFGPAHPDCKYFTDVSDSCDPVKCFTAIDDYRKGWCKATCNNCSVPLKIPEPSPNCGNLTDTKLGCDLQYCFKEDTYKECEGSCNYCQEPVKYGPVHPDCQYMTDMVTTCDRMQCFGAGDDYLIGNCEATCNNCPVPVKTPTERPGCENFTDIQRGCSYNQCYRWEDYRNTMCKGTCNHCSEPIKLGPVHPDCAKFTDTIENCDRMDCFRYTTDDFLKGKCPGTCNNCPVPMKTIDPHPNCANLTDTRWGCSLGQCYKTDSFQYLQCQGTCNHCKEPIKFGPVDPDCDRFTDTITNCDKMKCLTTKSEYYLEGLCKATCHNCPVPIKEVSPHPNCANLTDTKSYCKLSSCYRNSGSCDGTCNFCKETVKFPSPHPECTYFTDTRQNYCDKWKCLTGDEKYTKGTCKGTCNSCPVPFKTPPEHPDCAQFSDMRDDCELEFCYQASYLKRCKATCNHCVVKKKRHPDCDNMRDNFYATCRKAYCIISDEWIDDKCQWTCNNCDM